MIEVATNISPLTYYGAASCNAPQGFVYRGTVIANQLRKTVFKQGAGIPGVVVGNSRVDVMANMG